MTAGQRMKRGIKVQGVSGHVGSKVMNNGLRKSQSHGAKGNRNLEFCGMS